MKQFTKAVALVAVTTLFATAFTTSHRDQQTVSATGATALAPVAQVVIVGKRMTTLEKNQYDAAALAHSQAGAQRAESDGFGLAAR